MKIYGLWILWMLSIAISFAMGRREGVKSMHKRCIDSINAMEKVSLDFISRTISEIVNILKLIPYDAPNITKCIEELGQEIINTKEAK